MDGFFNGHDSSNHQHITSSNFFGFSNPLSSSQTAVKISDPSTSFAFFGRPEQISQTTTQPLTEPQITHSNTAVNQSVEPVYKSKLFQDFYSTNPYDVNSWNPNESHQNQHSQSQPPVSQNENPLYKPLQPTLYVSTYLTDSIVSSNLENSASSLKQPSTYPPQEPASYPAPQYSIPTKQPSPPRQTPQYPPVAPPQAPPSIQPSQTPQAQKPTPKPSLPANFTRQGTNNSIQSNQPPAYPPYPPMYYYPPPPYAAPGYPGYPGYPPPPMPGYPPYQNFGSKQNLVPQASKPSAIKKSRPEIPTFLPLDIPPTLQEQVQKKKDEVMNLRESIALLNESIQLTQEQNFMNANDPNFETLRIKSLEADMSRLTKENNELAKDIRIFNDRYSNQTAQFKAANYEKQLALERRARTNFEKHERDVVMECGNDENAEIAAKKLKVKQLEAKLNINL